MDERQRLQFEIAMETARLATQKEITKNGYQLLAMQKDKTAKDKAFWAMLSGVVKDIQPILKWLSIGLVMGLVMVLWWYLFGVKSDVIGGKFTCVKDSAGDADAISFTCSPK